MAAGKINLQKASGGITAITGVDGTGNTELVLPESGTLATTAGATETSTGLVELATAAEAQAGTDDTRAITPLKLFNSLKGSNQSLASNGYQKLPGGLIIQWGDATTSAGIATVIFPVAFPSICATLAVTADATFGSNIEVAGYSGVTTSGFNAIGVVTPPGGGAWSSPTGMHLKWIAIGY